MSAELVCTGRVIEWRRAWPYYFAPVPGEECAGIGEVAAMATSPEDAPGDCLIAGEKFCAAMQRGRPCPRV